MSIAIESLAEAPEHGPPPARPDPTVFARRSEQGYVDWFPEVGIGVVRSQTRYRGPRCSSGCPGSTNQDRQELEVGTGRDRNRRNVNPRPRGNDRKVLPDQVAVVHGHESGARS